MQFSKKDLFTIPNILTYIRLICVPIFVGVMIAFAVNKSAFQYLWAGFGLFLFASITDIADGYIARHFNMISDIGRVLDPVADKLLQCFALIMLVVVGGVHYVFAIFLVIKEVYMGVSSKYFMRASKRQVQQQSNKWGKAGASINFAGILIAFIVPLKDRYDWVKYVYIADVVILSAGMVLAVIAAVQYTYRYYQQLKQLRESGVLDTLDKFGNPLPVDIEKIDDNCTQSDQTKCDKGSTDENV